MQWRDNCGELPQRKKKPRRSGARPDVAFLLCVQIPSLTVDRVRHRAAAGGAWWRISAIRPLRRLGFRSPPARAWRIIRHSRLVHLHQVRRRRHQVRNLPHSTRSTPRLPLICAAGVSVDRLTTDAEGSRSRGWRSLAGAARAVGQGSKRISSGKKIDWGAIYDCDPAAIENRGAAVSRAGGGK
jgi:hypothetical protein